MSTILFTLTLCLANAVVVDVETVDGESYHGDLSAWSESTIVVASDGERHELPVDRVHLVRNQQQSDSTVSHPTVWVELHDGSRIAATSVQTKADNALIETKSGIVECPLRAIRTVRWRANEAREDTTWNEILKNDFEGDAIIVRRDDNLDFLEGTVQSVTDSAVSFKFDEQEIEVPLARLAGMVLFRPAGDGALAGHFRIELRDHSRWEGNRIAMSDGVLRVRTVEGVELSAPVGELVEATYATPSLVYVSDLKPEQVTVEPFLQPTIANDAVVALLYRPMMNQGFAARPLQLQFSGEIQPRQFAKGMALHSKTKLIYRLEEPFRRLRGVIGWDPDFGANGGSVQVLVRAGGKDVFDGVWNPDDPPVEIDVPINDAKRLELIVDYGDGSDVGDRINLCNLRLLK